MAVSELSQAREPTTTACHSFVAAKVLVLDCGDTSAHCRHKSNLPLPQEWRSTDACSPASVGISVANHSGGVIQGGSAIIFTEATTHGTLPWNPADGQRRRKTLFFKYSPAAVSWSVAHASTTATAPAL